MSVVRPFRGLLGVGALAVLLPLPAQARSSGAPFTSCDGCHGAGDGGTSITLTFEPPELTPGGTVTGTVTIEHARLVRAGLFLTTLDKGELSSGPGMQVTATGLTHSMPIVGQDGTARLSFDWKLPEEPSGTAVEVYAVAANGDARNQGDWPGYARFPVAWGCELLLLYRDLDGDGFGSSNLGLSGGCEAEAGWALVDDDCDENARAIHPDAEEVCNERDDDCDGEVDEGTEPRPLFVDADGDGFGTGEPAMLGCVPPRGFADRAADCDDENAARFPEASEVCDLFDNDCDGDVDEGARLRCGSGWCERLAATCDPDSCFPGEPRAELCNAFDDDCDGVIDNAASGCADGLVCLLGACLFPEDVEVVAAMGDQGAGLLPVPAAPPQTMTGSGESMPEPPAPGPDDGTAGSNASAEPPQPGSVSRAGAASAPDEGAGNTGSRTASCRVSTRGGGAFFLAAVALLFCRRSPRPGGRRYSAARALSGGNSE